MTATCYGKRHRLACLCELFHALFYDPPHRSWIELRERQDALIRDIKQCIDEIAKENA